VMTSVSPRQKTVWSYNDKKHHSSQRGTLLMGSLDRHPKMMSQDARRPPPCG
jgi:hypothetical protein